MQVKSHRYLFQVIHCTPIEGCFLSNVVFRQRSSVKYLLSKVFCQRSSSIKVRLPSKVVFCQRSSSVKGPLPSKVLFHRRSLFVRGRLPSNVIFHQRSSSVKGRLPSKVIFCQRSSFVKGHLLSKVIIINCQYISFYRYYKCQFID